MLDAPEREEKEESDTKEKKKKNGTKFIAVPRPLCPLARSARCLQTRPFESADRCSEILKGRGVTPFPPSLLPGRWWK
jgi:hypothetical protein